MKISAFLPLRAAFAAAAAAVVSAAFSASGLDWTPEKNPMRVTDSVRFAAAALDGGKNGAGETLVLAERLGGKQPPYSTRLVFLSLDEGRATALPVLENTDIVKLFFYRPGKLGAVVRDAASGQLRVGTVKLERGGEIAAFQPSGTPVPEGGRLAIAGKRYFISERKGGKTLIAGDLGKDDGGEQMLYCDIADPDLFAPDEKLLIAFSREKTQRFRLESGEFIPGEVETPGITPPRNAENFVPFDAKGKNFFCYQPEGALYFYDRGEFQKVVDPLSASAFALFPGDKGESRVLAAAGAKLNTLNFYAVPGSFKEVDGIRLSRIKPYDTGEIRYLFASNGGTVVAVDLRGNVMRIGRTGTKKWSKTILYAPRSARR